MGVGFVKRRGWVLFGITVGGSLVAVIVRTWIAFSGASRVEGFSAFDLVLTVAVLSVVFITVVFIGVSAHTKRHARLLRAMQRDAATVIPCSITPLEETAFAAIFGSAKSTRGSVYVVASPGRLEFWRSARVRFGVLTGGFTVSAVEAHAVIGKYAAIRVEVAETAFHLCPLRETDRTVLMRTSPRERVERMVRELTVPVSVTPEA
jgi:hypothetical protein